MSTTSPSGNGKGTTLPTSTLISISVSLLALLYAYTFIPGFGMGGGESSFLWMIRSWSVKTDYEHGWLVIPLILFMLYHTRDKMAAVTKTITWKGLFLFIPAGLIFLLSFRVGQPRVALIAFPLIIWGGVWFYAGTRAALLWAFPLLFFWLCIPVPAFQQATVWMQILASELGHLGGKLLGVDTYVQGTSIRSATGNWEAFSIAGGCSGMRSLMALIMISAAWAYLSSLSFWKKCILFLSAIPLAIIGNGLRITSIVVVAEYGDPKFASTTWHDWSGLLFFFPICLLGLACIHFLLDGQSFRKIFRRRKVVVKKNQSR